MKSGLVEVFCNGENPAENCYNDGKSKQVCLIESWGYFIGFYLMSKYYSGCNTSMSYKYVLSQGIRNYPYFYIDVYNELLKNFTVSQIFEPYKSFSVQSLTSWFNKFKSINTTIDSEKIKEMIKDKGYVL